MGIKITASKEHLFRLRLAAPNDTICLLRAFGIIRKHYRPALVEWGGFYLQHRLHGTYPLSNAKDRSTPDVFFIPLQLGLLWNFLLLEVT